MSEAPNDTGRVIDAPSASFVYRLMPRGLWPYAQLARWDRPIGWQLLMWPCFWSATLAAISADNAGMGLADTPHVIRPLLWHLLLFFIGAVAMRGAGCTYNDLIDQEIDSEVARTRSRPLPSGRVSRRNAKIFLVVQALIGLVVLLQFNVFSIVLGVLSLAVVAVYPFAKRVTDWPQLVLGLAFSWGALIGWSAQFASLAAAPIVLYLAAVVWTIGYDTIYAYQDREDDALIGVRSTARRFGERPRPWLAALYGLTGLLLLTAFALVGVGFVAYAALIAVVVMLGYQILVLDIHDAGACLSLFRFNGTLGLVLFAGLLADLVV